MKLMYFELVETCIESPNAYDGFLDLPIDENFLNKFSNVGKIVMMKNLEKPYFRIIVRGKYTIKGSLNNTEFRIIMPNDASIELLDEIKKIINSN